MKKLILVVGATVILTSFIIQTVYIDPTGTYQLDSKTKNEDGELYGYTGQIQVKKTGTDKIVMTFEVNKGAPSYNSGSFVDTLSYLANKAIYTDPETDATCKITFNFGRKGITVKEKLMIIILAVDLVMQLLQMVFI